MNELHPPTLPTEATPAPAYKNRTTGLVVFGVLTLLFGCLAELVVPLMLFGQMMAAKVPNAPPTNTMALLLPVAIYGTLGVTLIWLGIGSIRARRWARALLLILAWSSLAWGIIMTAVMPFILNKALANLPPNAQNGQPSMPPAAVTGMVVGMTLFFFVFGVLVPALWTFFYGSRHVKATCEERDPMPGWTDSCPLPVLGFSLWTWLIVPFMLIFPLTGHAVVPCFGVFISGLPGALFYVVFAAVWGWAGWWLYRSDVRGWWLILIAMGGFLVSGLLTYAHHDISEMWQLMGYSQSEIGQIKKIGLMTGNHMVWMQALGALPFLGYLLFIKKYLRKI
jgi:hypothetical protein